MSLVSTRANCLPADHPGQFSGFLADCRVDGSKEPPIGQVDKQEKQTLIGKIFSPLKGRTILFFLNAHYQLSTITVI